ncbi:MAG TPA: hypothetical protein VJL54_03965 [Nitrososphaera sp.]|nr:hypothetical protein [Nitrososphaera sp.]
MQPHKKKVLKMTAVAAGIIVVAFMLPTVIIPAAIGVSTASDCAISSGCAGETYDKCGAYQTSGDSTSFIDSMGRGMRGMLCMMGLDGSSSNAVVLPGLPASPVTLNKI